MASGLSNKAKLEALEAYLSAVTVKVLLLKDTYTFDPDDQFVADVVADEVTASGYARGTLANKTFTKDDTNDFAYMDADNILFSGMAAGQSVKGAYLYVERVNDADSELLGWYEFASAVDTGDDVFVQWNTPANGGVIKAA